MDENWTHDQKSQVQCPNHNTAEPPINHSMMHAANNARE